MLRNVAKELFVAQLSLSVLTDQREAIKTNQSTVRHLKKNCVTEVAKMFGRKTQISMCKSWLFNKKTRRTFLSKCKSKNILPLL